MYDNSSVGGCFAGVILAFGAVLLIIAIIAVPQYFMGQPNYGGRDISQVWADQTATATAETYQISSAVLNSNVISTSEGINLSFGGTATFTVNVEHTGTYDLYIDGRISYIVQVAVNNSTPISVNGDGKIQLNQGSNQIVLSNEMNYTNFSADSCRREPYNCSAITDIRVLPSQS